MAAEPGDHGLGRSRGGLTTKVHLACEQGQRPLSVVITAGQRGDSPQFQIVLGRIRVPRPVASAPFYLPAYPVGANVPTLNCQDVPVENCPDHGPAVAGLAHLFESGVYRGGVLGHDHLMAGPGSGGDFNVAWVPTLVLFTPDATITHITTLTQLKSLINSGAVITVPLNGTPFEGVPLPNLTFHCSVVSAAAYARGVPFTS